MQDAMTYRRLVNLNMRAGNQLYLVQWTDCCKDEKAFANRLACNVVRIACLIQLNRKFIFVNSSLDFFKLLLVLIETYTCCRGGSGTDHYVLMAGPGRQFPNESPVRVSRFSREGRNHGDPEPCASKPAKVLRSSRYAETACRARAHLEPHSLPDSTSLSIGWLEIQPIEGV